MKKIGIGFILFVLAFVLYLGVSSCHAPANADVPACEITAPLDSLFSTMFPNPGDPGAVVIVRQGDSIKYNRSFGMADLERGIPLSDSTVFNIASASKTYVTAALVKLRDQGRLTLDDSLSMYFPNFRSPIFRRVTLRHVLSHTSGLPDKRPRTADQWNEYVKDNQSPFGYGPDYLLYGREEELTAFFETLDTLKSEPGTKFEYQNAPYLLLPSIIEQLTGRNFESWMQQNIFNPAGLTETEYYDPARPHPRMAHAYSLATGPRDPGRYRSTDGRWDEQDYGETEFFLTRADHGICTTPREFTKWINALYQGKVVDESSLSEVNRPVIDTDEDSIQYGLGLFVQDIESKPLKVFHSRNNGGFSIFEAVFPRQHLYYLIFANRADCDRLATAEKIDSIFMAHKWLVPRQVVKE